MSGGRFSCLFRREADRAGRRRRTAAAAVDKRIEHQAQKLRHQLKRAALGAGRGFAIELGERVGQIAAGQSQRR